MSEIICPLTGVKIDSNRQGDTIFYTLEFAGNTVNVLWCYDCFRKAEKNNKTDLHHVVKGLIANNKLTEDIFLHNLDCNLSGISDNFERFIFPDFLDTISYPKTASQKMDNLLLFLYRIQGYDGQSLHVDYRVGNIILNFFKNFQEFVFYIESLKRISLIDARITNTGATIKFTHEGLNKVVELEEREVDSKSCFIAMAFDSQTTDFREAIKRALTTNKYEHILIDEEHLDSDKTIPDAILNKIRKAKFVIADFTLHRNGVYFESGYALGLSKQVIYTCREDDFVNAHFDIKQLQHVLYKTPEELEKKLADKIEFWIR